MSNFKRSLPKRIRRGTTSLIRRVALHLPVPRTTLLTKPRSSRAEVERAMDAESETCVDVGYWTKLDDGRIECGVCPRFCKMRPGQRGLCFVRRAREDGAAWSSRATADRLDSVSIRSRKSRSIIFFPALRCCPSGPRAAISLARSARTGTFRRAAKSRAQRARGAGDDRAAAERLGCASVAYTYNDPVIFLEYALDTAGACRERGVKNVAVTAGFVCAEPRKRLFAGMDAANVDLKGFTERFYAKRCAGRSSRFSIRSNISFTRRMSGPRSRRCSSRARTIRTTSSTP